jgi:hypothetical protein
VELGTGKSWIKIGFGMQTAPACCLKKAALEIVVSQAVRSRPEVADRTVYVQGDADNDQ